MLESFPESFQANAAVFSVSIALLTIVAAVDFATGPEVSLSIFYLIPSALAAWFAGRKGGIVVGIISSMIWLSVELNFGRQYHHKLVPYCNGLLQLVMALLSAILTARVREREQEVFQEMTARKRAEMELHVERVLADAIEKEQQRLGRDLHDGLGQHLVSTGFVASMLKTKLQEKELPEAKDADDLTALIADAIGQTRRVSRGLSPVKLEAEGLSSALQELADNVSSHSRIACRFESHVGGLTADPTVSSNLYRIAQEAINNALKHGAAKTIVVQLQQTKFRLELTIVNDGKEFHPPTEGFSGMGLRVMEHRARLIGAKCQVGPGPFGGTKVRCTVPIDSRS